MSTVNPTAPTNAELAQVPQQPQTQGQVPVEKNAAAAPNSSSRYHPFLFALLALLSIVELGITASLVHSGRDHRYPTSQYRSGVLFLLFLSIWTMMITAFNTIFILMRVSHPASTIGGSSIWLTVNAVLWGIASGVFTRGRPERCGFYYKTTICHTARAAEAFGWIIFTLTVLSLLSAVYHAGSGSRGFKSGHHS